MPVNLPPRILIVEDEAMIVFMLEDLLAEAGFEIAGVATTLDLALSLIETCGCDAAILDANLAGVSSAPAALALTARAIPYLVVSGYSAAQQDDAYAAGVYVAKPFKTETLLAALWSILPASEVFPS